MGFYVRVIISIETGKMACMDKKIYTRAARRKMEEDSVKSIMSIAETLLEMKSMYGNKYYKRQEVLSMVAQIAIDLDGGVIGENYESILSSNEEDKMDLIHDMCNKVLNKYNVDNPPKRFKWIYIK